ncbi:Spy/CpxP family protein refolding chaperone [Neptunomonas sp.]|uniref:Spy/CpxP family protein refolding chaperone n=1 Tax=Neptunomonas sp. TaxID=1971898 RepID=UPI00356918F3
MKKLTIALISLPILLAAAASYAGMQHSEGYGKCDRDGGMYKHDRNSNKNRMIERMSEKLDLSETQQQDLQQLFESKQAQRQEMHKQMRSLHQATRNLDPSAADYDQRLSEAKQAATELAVNKIDQKVDMKAAMANILTADQLSKMEKMRDGSGSGKEHGKHRGEGYEKRTQSQE